MIAWLQFVDVTLLIFDLVIPKLNFLLHWNPHTAKPFVIIAYNIWDVTSQKNLLNHLHVDKDTRITKLMDVNVLELFNFIEVMLQVHLKQRIDQKRHFQCDSGKSVHNAPLSTTTVYISIEAESRPFRAVEFQNLCPTYRGFSFGFDFLRYAKKQKMPKFRNSNILFS